MTRSQQPDPQFQVITLVGNLTSDPSARPGA